MRPGERYLFAPTATTDQCGRALTPGVVQIVRELDDDERDPEVGRMFEVRYLTGGDGATRSAFIDELEEIPNGPTGGFTGD